MICRMWCHDCGAMEGELHQKGCDMERCLICKRQLLSCPKHTWEDFKDEEREPYFEVPNVCSKCGKLYPELIMISDTEWKSVCGVTFPTDCILCKDCLKFVKELRGKNG